MKCLDCVYVSSKMHSEADYNRMSNLWIFDSRLVIHDGETYGMTRDRVTLYDSSVIPLSLDQLRKVWAIQHNSLLITC